MSLTITVNAAQAAKPELIDLLEHKSDLLQSQQQSRGTISETARGWRLETPDTTAAALQFPIAMVVARDIGFITSWTRALGLMGVAVECLPQRGHTLATLAKKRIQAVVVDCAGDPCSLKLINEIRSCASSKDVIILAVVERSAKLSDAFSAGATLVLAKPLSAELMARVLRLAYGNMVRNRRRYFRQSLETPVTLRISGQQRQATMLDLSEGGMGLRSAEKLAPGQEVEFQFQLSRGATIAGRGEVIWRHDSGSAGVRFRQMSPAVYSDLEAWLSERFELLCAAAAAATASAATAANLV